MTLHTAKINNDAAYIDWRNWGMPEAFDRLNDSNRELIAAYKAENPNAKGYKVHTGIVDLDGKIYNFHCDVIFDGSPEAIAAINAAQEETDRIDIAENANGICLVWT